MRKQEYQEIPPSEFSGFKKLWKIISVVFIIFCIYQIFFTDKVMDTLGRSIGLSQVIGTEMSNAVTLDKEHPLVATDISTDAMAAKLTRDYKGEIFEVPVRGPAEKKLWSDNFSVDTVVYGRKVSCEIVVYDEDMFDKLATFTDATTGVCKGKLKRVANMTFGGMVVELHEGILTIDK